ncbi:MAG: type I-E CRISPR-associated endoribonuclease Cas2e [Dehalococcoidales bacterium]|nr:type I-E CRISPR-associated endoribonuclease Cas2e [Dehalococcoidales bacterium]
MSLRGALSRWLLEPKTGIFLGDPSARVRDELWMQAIKKAKESGSVIQIWNDKNPQGFSYRQYGVQNRKFVDVDGLSLIQIKHDNIEKETTNDNNNFSDPENV